MLAGVWLWLYIPMANRIAINASISRNRTRGPSEPERLGRLSSISAER